MLAKLQEKTKQKKVELANAREEEKVRSSANIKIIAEHLLALMEMQANSQYSCLISSCKVMESLRDTKISHLREEVCSYIHKTEGIKVTCDLINCGAMFVCNWSKDYRLNKLCKIW